MRAGEPPASQPDTPPPVPYVQPKYLGCAETAKLVRAALKTRFPAVRFSIRSKTYSGGASIDVRRTDGPTSRLVEEVTNPFRRSDFDSSQDMKVSREPTELNGELVRFGADLITCSRELSAAFANKLARLVARLWGVPAFEATDGAYFLQWPAEAVRCQVHGRDFPTLVRVYAEDRTQVPEWGAE